MKQSAALSADLARTAERLTSELDRAASSLRADKVDTTTLAGTLTEMAARLTGSGGGGSGGGGGGRAAGKGSSSKS